jgi:hypothetical protein
MLLAGGYVNNQPLTSIAIGIFLLALGGLLGLDVRGISTALHRQHERPGREQNSASDINWYIVGGRIFVVFGLLFLVVGIVYAA